MSFQGDVAGIGLGELLQGLSRGGRDGVLTLYGGRVSATIGLRKGQLYLLPGPDEAEDEWRIRCQRAFADDPHPELESARRTRIARAARIETLYRMLEAGNLHFRFEQGPLPLPPNHPIQATKTKSLSLDEVGGGTGPSPWGQGITVEYLLLEQARISDESRTGPTASLRPYDMPRALDPARHPPEVRDLLEQCNGRSTLEEIADRLGDPFSLARGLIGEHVQAGNLRLAHPRELLASAQRELELGRIGRAATRLAGWIEASPPGPVAAGDAELLLQEWQAGRLEHILHALQPRVGRALLRKLDGIEPDLHVSRDRWRALLDAHRTDEITMVHTVALRLTATDSPEARTFHDLLRLARAFQERELFGRTRTLLRLAARHLPTRPETRVEIGRRMLETGLAAEGTRWLLETAQELLVQEEPERALVPIRTVLREVPDQPDAKKLFIRARALQARQRRRRWNSAAALAIGLVLSLVAAVKFRSYHRVERWIDQVNGLVATPGEAISLLDRNFGSDLPPRLADLRERLIELQAQEERRRLALWSEQYSDAEEACRFGDPLLALRRALELPARPGAQETTGVPERQELLGLVASRLGQRSAELDLPVDATIEQLNQEERLVDLLDEILVQLQEETTPREAAPFRFRVSELRDEILARREARAAERAALLEREREMQQDALLAVARAHAQAGDLKRSLTAYERLLESDRELAELPTLKREIEEVREHHAALQRALELAEAGDHEGARIELAGACERPIEHLLPFRVESRPPGVRVEMPDGRVRQTPFVTKSAIGERLELRFSSAGHGDQLVALDAPRDVLVHLHREPERAWASEHRVEAAPVPAGDDHVLADRRGRLVRLDARSEARWERKLDTLGGVARTPIFLPGRPGHLLVVSEDGRAWLVDAATGATTGPREVGAPPVAGPEITRGGVSVSFADGRVAVWSDRLEPAFYEVESLVPRPRNAGRKTSTTATFTLLRSSIDTATELESPWNGWTIEAREEHFVVRNPEGRGFTADRHGQWIYLAWESPKAFVPYGRVWISDEAGLRAYVPTLEDLVTLED